MGSWCSKDKPKEKSKKDVSRRSSAYDPEMAMAEVRERQDSCKDGESECAIPEDEPEFNERRSRKVSLTSAVPNHGLSKFRRSIRKSIHSRAPEANDACEESECILSNQLEIVIPGAEDPPTTEDPDERNVDVDPISTDGEQDGADVPLLGKNEQTPLELAGILVHGEIIIPIEEEELIPDHEIQQFVRQENSCGTLDAFSRRASASGKISPRISRPMRKSSKGFLEPVMEANESAECSKIVPMKGEPSEPSRKRKTTHLPRTCHPKELGDGKPPNAPQANVDMVPRQEDSRNNDQASNGSEFADPLGSPKTKSGGKFQISHKPSSPRDRELARFQESQSDNPEMPETNCDASSGDKPHAQ